MFLLHDRNSTFSNSSVSLYLLNNVFHLITIRNSLIASLFIIINKQVILAGYINVMFFPEPILR